MAIDPILSKEFALIYGGMVIAYCTDFTLEINKQIVDVTKLGDEWKNKLVDVKEWKVAFNGMITRGDNSIPYIWDPETSYSAGGFVIIAGSCYEAQSTTLGHNPTTDGGVHWIQVSEWSAAATYPAGELLYRTTVSNEKRVYKSLQAGNLNHEPLTSPTWWERIEGGFAHLITEIKENDLPVKATLKSSAAATTYFYGEGFITALSAAFQVGNVSRFSGSFDASSLLGRGTTPASGSSYESEVETYISGLVTPLTEGQLTNLNTLVLALKSGLGISSLSEFFDVFALSGGETSESSLKNLVKNSHHGTLGAVAPGFIQFEGFRNSLKTGYINSGFNPYQQGINFTQTANAIGFYTRNDTAVTTADSVVGNGIYSRWMLRYTTDIVRGNNNGGAVVSSINPNTTTNGFYVFCRDGNNIKVSKNKAAFVTNAANAAALNDYNYYILGSNNAGTFQYGSGAQVSCYFFSKLPTIEEVAVINDAIEAYMDANGKGIQ